MSDADRTATRVAENLPFSACLRERGFRLLDIQYETKATSIFRPVKISRSEYLRRLTEVRELSCQFA